MSNKPITRKSENPLSAGWVLSMFLLATIAAGTAWFFISYTTEKSASGSPNDGESDVEATSASYRSSADKKSAAESFRQKMLDADKKLLAKYREKRDSRKKEDSPDQEQAYRNWRDQKQQTQRFLSRFKNERTSDPASVKQQMIKSMKRMEEDAPIR